MIRSVVRGYGAALPKRVVTNRDLEDIVETTDEWIVQRTGIRQRYIAGDDETTASLGEAAARAALDNAGLTPDDIDLVLVATSTPNNTFPATAVEIQNRLGMKHGYAFDLQAVCTGFVYAMTTADLHLRGGMAKRALVIGAETFSTGRTAPPASCSAMALVPSSWKRKKAPDRSTTGAFWPPSCARMVRTRTSSTSMAALPPRAPSGTCAWKAARSSSMRWP
jgi:3-hydroxy-3-methylglutaryl CoA synthase